MQQQKITMTREGIRNSFQQDSDPWEIMLRFIGIEESPNNVSIVWINPNNLDFTYE